MLYDRGYVSMPEPFHKLVNQGMILGETEYTGYRTEAGVGRHHRGRQRRRRQADAKDTRRRSPPWASSRKK